MQKKSYYRIDKLVLVLVSLLSIISAAIFIYFGKNLLYGDAISRLNISRKLVDNLTPGIAQIGNVWLPLPQILTLPFNLNYHLWQTGISGAIMNMFFFIIGGWWLYKAGELLTKSRFAAFAGFLVYALNINLLYKQSTAMSEMIFISLTIGAAYYLLLWTNTHKLNYLLASGFYVSCATLVRYEALMLLIAFGAGILVYSFLERKHKESAEGYFYIFMTLACLGFSLWTIYLWIIFGDPLYWKNYYIDINPALAAAQPSGAPKNLFTSTWVYLTATVWMNGIIPSILSLIGAVWLLIDSIKKKKWEWFPVGALFSLFVFMVLTINRNTPIRQPELSIANILSFNTNFIDEFNIRYGLIMMPFIALTIAYLFSKTNKWVHILLYILLSIQLFNYVNYSYTAIYQVPVHKWQEQAQGGERNKQFVEWFQTNYDDGLILMSASRFDPQMFQLGFEYKNYIHEGTGKYWKTSLVDPAEYAKWVVVDTEANRLSGVSDLVARNVNERRLQQNFNRVYQREGITVYKKK